MRWRVPDCDWHSARYEFLASDLLVIVIFPFDCSSASSVTGSPSHWPRFCPSECLNKSHEAITSAMLYVFPDIWRRRGDPWQLLHKITLLEAQETLSQIPHLVSSWPLCMYLGMLDMTGEFDVLLLTDVNSSSWVVVGTPDAGWWYSTITSHESRPACSMAFACSEGWRHRRIWRSWLRSVWQDYRGYHVFV